MGPSAAIGASAVQRASVLRIDQVTTRLHFRAARPVLLLGALSLCARHSFAGNRPKLVEGGVDQLGGVLTAGPNGARYSFPGGGQLILRPGTQAHVAAVPQELPLRPGRRTPTYSVMLRDGRVDVDVKPKGLRSAIMVAAPSGLKTIVLKGQVAAMATASRASAASLDAEALATVDDRWESLEPGTLWTVQQHDPQIRKANLLAPPTSFTGSTVILALTGQVELRDFWWNAVPGARAYEVTLTSQGEVAPPQTISTSSTKLSGDLRALTPGRYQLRVASIDALGFAGRPSEPFEFRVLGVELPLGAAALDPETIELGRGQTVTFTETDGMLMRYTGAEGLPADSPVGLSGAHSRVLLLSPLGSLTGTVVRLVPRKLAASIQFEPKNLTWPGPPATVSVELTNDGEPIPAWLVPEFTATLNLEPIEADVTRDGNSLKATVTGPSGNGPWVLRVEVRDQTGGLLGRDFVEIGTRPTTSSDPRPSSTAQRR